ncbi:MAG TPA: acyltransferase [Pyrinomonadaceae bacterium]|nr:acyltransferase [Pyrinomonadaceae bacterium]
MSSLASKVVSFTPGFSAVDAAAPFRLGYRPALDGLRGVAILAVLAVHTSHIFGWSLLKGANAGVDIFFVLSGFLITTLLIEEWEQTGDVSLKSFYWRRALRLIPALVVLLAALYFLSDLLFSPVEANDTRRAISVAFVYASDLALAFFQLHLGALQHTWSLAIEEHFYLIWPVVLLAALKLGISKKRLVLITLLAVIVSGLQRASLHQFGAPPVRTYYGIDTRADALLIGCVTGLCVSWGLVHVRALRPLLIPALILIVFCMVATGFGSSFMTVGGFTLLAIATGVVIVNVVLGPPGYLRGFLECGPLVWIGRISYGLYLWHYPIFKATSFVKLSWPVQLTVALAITLIVTSLSYYLIERPALSLKRRHKEAQKRVITAR